MGVEKRVRSVRLSEEESLLFERIQEKFSPFTKTFKDTVVLCARLVWRMICTPGIFGDFIQECQRLQCTTPYIAPKQMQLVFGEPIPAMYPRFGSTGAADRPRPLSEPITRTKVQAGMAAWGTSCSGSFRRVFAHRSTGVAA